ncbi:reverse transcriptase-like protein [Holzapfeliella sp. JNUCC 72]
MLKIHTDGAFDIKTNQATIGYIIETFPKSTLVKQQAEKIFAKDNHEAEFIALKHALDYLITTEQTNQVLSIETDSKILSDSINKRYAKNYQNLTQDILNQLDRFYDHYIKLIPDKQNFRAHKLANDRLFQLKTFKG